MNRDQLAAADTATTAATPRPTLAVRLRRRAWSRAGAVAAVLATGPTRRVLTLSSRLVLLVAGALAIAAGVSLTLWNELGPGPLDVFIGAIAERTGVPLAVGVWAVVGSMVAIAWLLGRRPGFGTLLSPLIVGPAMQTFVALLDRWEPPTSLAVRVALHVVAVVLIGIGSGSLIVSGLGSGSGELLAGAASDRMGHTEERVRPVIEFAWVAVGVALGGPAGLGTVIVAILIAPAVAHGFRVVDAAVARSRRGLAATRETIVARDRAAREFVTVGPD